MSFGLESTHKNFLFFQDVTKKFRGKYTSIIYSRKIGLTKTNSFLSNIL